MALQIAKFFGILSVLGFFGMALGQGIGFIGVILLVATILYAFVFGI